LRVGITGGTGFLGGHLARKLLDRGDSVVVFTRRPGVRLPGGAASVAWNPYEEPAPGAALRELDAVVHLAGEPVLGLWTRAKRERIRRSRLLGTTRLLEGLRLAEPRPRVLLSGSATGFFGNRGDEALTETSAPGEGFLASLCREWESAASPAEDLRIRLVLLRTSLPLHPSGGFLKPQILPFRLGLGTVLGSGKQWVPWIHLQDWVDLALFALDTESLRGPLHVTAPNPVTNRAFTKTLARVLGRPAPFRIPAFVLRAALRDLADEAILAGQRLLPEKALRAGFRFAFPELEPALRDLFRPRG